MSSMNSWEKGTRANNLLFQKYVVNFVCIIARYRPKLFIFGAIENEVKKGALRFCARSNVQLLSFNVPEYHPLQACFTVEIPLLLNCLRLCIWAWPDIEQSIFHVYPRISMLYPPTLKLTAYLQGPFHPG